MLCNNFNFSFVFGLSCVYRVKHPRIINRVVLVPGSDHYFSSVVSCDFVTTRTTTSADTNLNQAVTVLIDMQQSISLVVSWSYLLFIRCALSSQPLQVHWCAHHIEYVRTGCTLQFVVLTVVRSDSWLWIDLVYVTSARREMQPFTLHRVPHVCSFLLRSGCD